MENIDPEKLPVFSLLDMPRIALAPLCQTSAQMRTHVFAVLELLWRPGFAVYTPRFENIVCCPRYFGAALASHSTEAEKANAQQICAAMLILLVLTQR